jgi:hypothetical protein
MRRNAYRSLRDDKSGDDKGEGRKKGEGSCGVIRNAYRSLRDDKRGMRRDIPEG